MRAIFLMMLAASLLLSGCRTMQPVDAGQWSSLEGRVEAGDTVEVVTRDGAVRKFVVTDVTPAAIVGGDTRIAREDITRLHVNAVHKGRTFGAAFAGGGAVLLMMMAAAMASLLGG